MEIVIWGAGARGKRIYKILPNDNVVAFIDHNDKYKDSYFHEKPIISYVEYKHLYDNAVILVSLSDYEEVESLLIRDGIKNYWILTRDHMDLHSFNDTNLHDIFREIYLGDMKYLIKGENIYSLLLCKFLKSEKLDVKYYTNDIVSLDDKYKNILAKSNIEIVDEVDISFSNKMYICDSSYEDTLKNIQHDIKLLDYSDHQLKLERYFNPRLSKFKGIHNGKRCFIIANGPSLSMDDLDKIDFNRDYSFGVNYIFKSKDKTSWRPNYFVVNDVYFANVEKEHFINYESEAKFVLDAAYEFWDMFLPENIYKYYSSVCFESNAMKVSEDIRYGMYVGTTVIHICLQIAIYMGFSEIYLLGADTTRFKKEQTHFIKNYHSKEALSKVKPVFDVDRVIDGYISINQYADSKGIRIMNATRGGELEVFERVDFDNLFKE